MSFVYFNYWLHIHLYSIWKKKKKKEYKSHVKIKSKEEGSGHLPTGLRSLYKPGVVEQNIAPKKINIFNFFSDIDIKKKISCPKLDFDFSWTQNSMAF